MRGGTGSPQQVARIIQPNIGRRSKVSRRGGPPVQDPFHRNIGWEVQANQLRGLRLRVSIRLRLCLCMLATMKARSGLPLDHTSLDNAKTLAWIDRRQTTLRTLLVPMPRPSRFTTQPPDFPVSSPASTGPAEPMAGDEDLHGLPPAVRGLPPHCGTLPPRLGQAGQDRGDTGKRPVIPAQDRS